MQLFEKGNAQSINTAVEKMKSISGWKDSDEKIKEFSERYEVVFAKEHAEKEEKERIEKLKSEYDKKYSELLKSKYKNQNKLEKVQKELTAMNNKMKSEASAKFGICAIGVFFLGAGVIILFFGVDEGSSGTGKQRRSTVKSDGRFCFLQNVRKRKLVRSANSRYTECDNRKMKPVKEF